MNPRLGDTLNGLPIAIFSAAWLGPYVLFWLQVWGPLRPYDVAPVEAPGLAFVLAGIVASLAPLALPRSWYTTRRIERHGRLYEPLGVRLFKTLVPDGDLVNRVRRGSTPGHRVIRDRDSARAFIARTVQSERYHLVLLVAGLFAGYWATRVEWYGWALLLHGGNVLGNLYPAMLQRYTRARITRVTEAQRA